MGQDHLFAEILNSFAHLEKWIPGCGTWPVDLLIGKLPEADPANAYRLADAWSALADRLNGYYNDVGSLGNPIMSTWQGDGTALEFMQLWSQHLQDIGSVMQSVDAMQQMAQGYGLQLETEEFFIACMLIQLLIEAITAIISAFFTGGISLGGLGAALAAARIGIKEAFEKCIEAILHLGEMLATGELRRIIAETSLKDLLSFAGRELVDHGGQALKWGRDAVTSSLGPRSILARAAADDAAKQFEQDVVKTFLRKELEDQLAHVSTDLASKEAMKALDTAVEDVTRRVAADVQQKLLDKFTGKALEDAAGTGLADLGERLGADGLAAQTQSMVDKFVADQVARRTLLGTAGKYVGELALHGALFMGKINLGAQLFELVTGERSSIDFGELGITLAQGGLMGGLMFGHGLLGMPVTGGLAGTAVAAAMDGGQALYGAVTGQKVDINWGDDLWKGARDGVRMGLVFSAPGVLAGMMPRPAPEGFPGHEVFSLDDPRLGANVFTLNRQTGEIGFVSEFGGAGARLADGSFVRLDGEGDLIASHRAMDFVEADPPAGSGAASRPVALLERGPDTPPRLNPPRPDVQTPGRPPEGPLGERPLSGERPPLTGGGDRPPDPPNGDHPPEPPTTPRPPDPPTQHPSDPPNGDQPPEPPTTQGPPEPAQHPDPPTTPHPSDPPNGDRPPEPPTTQGPPEPAQHPSEPAATQHSPEGLGSGPEPSAPRPEIPAEQVPIRQPEPPLATAVNVSHAEAVQAALHDAKAPEALRQELATHLGAGANGEPVPLSRIEQTVQDLSLAGRQATLGTHPETLGAHPETPGAHPETPGAHPETIGPGGPHEPINWVTAAAGGKEVSETLPAQLFHDVLETRVPGGLAHADPTVVRARAEELARQLLATDPKQVSSVDTARRLREYAATELSHTDAAGRSRVDPTKLDHYVDETVASARGEETQALDEPSTTEPPAGPPRPPVPEHPTEAQPPTHPAPTHPAPTHSAQHPLAGGHPPDRSQLVRHQDTSYEHPQFDRKFMELREATPGGEKHWFLVTEHVTHYWAEADYGRLPIEDLDGGATGPLAQVAAHHAAQDLATREYAHLVDVTDKWLAGDGSIEDVASVGGMSAAVVLHDGRIVAATSFRERTVQTRVDTHLTDHDWRQLKQPDRQQLASGYAGSRRTALAAEAETALHPLVREALGDVPPVLRSATHSRCAEPIVISRIARIVEADLRQELGGEPPDFQERLAQRLQDVVRGAPIASHRNDGTPIDRSEQLPCSTDDLLISRFQMHSDYIDRALSDSLVDAQHRLIVFAKPGDPLRDYSALLPEAPPGHVTVVVHGSVAHGEIGATLGDVRGGGIELARALQHIIAEHLELAGKSLVLVSCEADATGVTRGIQTSLIREVSVRLGERVVGSPHVLLVSEHGDIDMAVHDPAGTIVVGDSHLSGRPTAWHEAVPTYDRQGRLNGVQTHDLPEEHWPFPAHGPHQPGHQVLAGDHELSQHAPFRHAEAFADPEYHDVATAYEQAVGAYYFNDAPTLQAVRDAVGELRHVLTELALARHPEWSPAEARAHADRAFFRDDAPDSAGQVGLGVPLDDIIAHGNLRELMTSFYNAAYFDRNNPDNLAHALRDLIDTRSWEAAGHAGVNVYELRRVEHVLDRSVLRWIGERFDEGRFPGDDPFGMGDVMLLSDHKIRDGIEMIRSQMHRDRREPDEQLALSHTPGDYDQIGTPLGQFERGYLEQVGGGPLDDDAKLPWREGATYYETTGPWAEHAAGHGLVPVAGVSGTTARMLTAAKLIGLDEATTKSFLDGLMGWMLPGRDHSIYEILRGGEFAGIVSPEFRDQQFDPTYTYRHLPGIDAATLRSLAPEGLPHEKVYLDQATATPPGFSETKPEVVRVAQHLWPQLASGHVHDPDLRDWLTANGVDPNNPADVMALAHQVSQAHVIALTVYTQHAHFLINNVIRTELWTHNDLAVRGIFNKRVDQLIHSYLDDVASARPVEPLPVELHGLVHTGDDAGSPLHPAAQRWVDADRALRDAQQRLAAGDTSARADIRAARQALKAAESQLMHEVDQVRDGLYREVRWHADMAYDALLRLPTVGDPNAPVLAFRGDNVGLPFSPLYGHPLHPDAATRVFLSVSRSPQVGLGFIDTDPGAAHKVLVVYKLTGMYARDVSVFSSYPEEEELLFPPGSLMLRVDDPALAAQVRTILGVSLPPDTEIIVMEERSR